MMISNEVKTATSCHSLNIFTPFTQHHLSDYTKITLNLHTSHLRLQPSPVSPPAGILLIKFDSSHSSHRRAYLGTWLRTTGGSKSTAKRRT